MVEEECDAPIELPTEPDRNLLLSTLQAQFPGASGLKYINEETKCFRGVRLNDGKLYPPCNENGWANYIYHCVFPKGILLIMDRIPQMYSMSMFSFFFC